jgi:prephenate dehydrogenase
MKFKRISVIGLGLIGASLARAIQTYCKKQTPQLTILGYDHNFKAKEKKEILKYGIDSYETDFKYLCNTDLVILCAPVEENVKLLKKIKRFLGKSTLVVDASSTKQVLSQTAAEENINFIGLHPIAGSERSGYLNSDPELFSGKPFIICPGNPEHKSNQVEALKTLIESIGGKAFCLSPAEHDAIFAQISHLPQLLSTLLINNSQEHLPLSGTGLIDMSRLAASPWHIWAEILSTNKQEILNALSSYNQTLTELKEALASDDYTWIQKQFESANKNYQSLKTLHSL